jgi:hypothetical protein
LRSLRDTRELRELLVAKSTEAFGNVSLARTRCITKLLAEFVSPTELRPRE